MTTASLKSSIRKKLQNLSKEKLVVVEHFVSFIAERADNADIKVLLNVSGNKQKFKAGKKMLH